MIDLARLAGRLNRTCRAALERAAQRCLGTGHGAIEIEHLLLELTQEPGSDLARALDRYDVDRDRLAADLMAAADRLSVAGARTPAISAHLADALEVAWLVASIDLAHDEIGSAALLRAVLEHPPSRAQVTASGPGLARIPHQKLAEDLPGLIAGGAEHARTARSERAVEAFTIDLTRRARAGELDPVVGREAEIGRVIEILMRRRRNNPMLTGEAGVGKTAIVEGLAQRIAAGNAPAALADVSLLSLDLGLLLAGTSARGELEERLSGVVEAIAAAPGGAILFIGEAHTLVGAGGGGRGDATSLLEPLLARNGPRIIAETSWSDYKRNFETDAALARRFEVVKVDEPSPASTIEILRQVGSRLEGFHGVRITEEALSEAAWLAKRYVAGRQLPDKAISVLDTACARAVIAHSAPGGGGEANPPVPPPAVDGKAVAEVVSEWTGVPVGAIRGETMRTALTLKSRLAERIVGQDEALESIVRRVQTFYAGLGDPGKPTGVFLLCGPSGVGKTETAMALAELLFGGLGALISVNMSEYQEAHSISGLKGAPPGYVGYGRGGVLTEAVRRQPYSLLLLDEIEKAHGDVIELFYQVFDRGLLDDSEGVAIDFTNTLIILTSNVGSEILTALSTRHVRPNADELMPVLRPALAAHFAPAFLGRLTVAPYFALGPRELDAIVRLKLGKIQQRFAVSRGADLSYDEAVARAIAQAAARSPGGAREVDAIITQQLLPLLSGWLLERLVRQETVSGAHIRIDAQGVLTMGCGG